MFDYSYPSASKKGYSEEVTYLPTAEKSQYRQESEAFLSHTPDKGDFRSPGRRSRASEAKRSINECIEIMSDKKKMNEEAFIEVQQINHEIINSLTNYNPSKQAFYEGGNKTSEPYRNGGRGNIVTSPFQWMPFTNPQAAPPEQTNLGHKEASLNQQNVNLRSRLNTEIKKNNDLLKYVTTLESEISILKASKGPSSSNVALNDLVEENRYLKNQLSASNAQVPYNLIEELERLKSQNNALRRDTVSLLKAKQY